MTAMASLMTFTFTPLALSSSSSSSSSLFLGSSVPPPTRFCFSPPPKSQALRFPCRLVRRKKRASTAVIRAGPSASTYAFAFALPFSLLAGTIFAALKIGDNLDRKYLEELAIQEANREVDEEEGEEDWEDEEEEEDSYISVEVEPAAPPTRNRPIRKA